MKTIFIPVKIKLDLSKEFEKIFLNISKNLPKNIALVYSIQYKDIALKIKEIISEKGKHNIVSFSQILGCTGINKFDKKIQAVLLIGSGKFHAISLAKAFKKIPVYIFDNGIFNKITKKEVEILEKKQKASYLKFLNSDNIGILISLKPGQQNFKKALEFKKNLEKKNKNVYLFICDNINTNEFENFPEIQSWVNTACPRLDMDYSTINLSDIKF